MRKRFLTFTFERESRWLVVLYVLIPLLALLLFILLPGLSRRWSSQEQQEAVGLFIAAGARHVERMERGGIHEVTYEVDAAYPASSFLCELSAYLDQRHWRGLREDALNPGMPSSLVDGWGDLDARSPR
jgi:hypothetical protein